MGNPIIDGEMYLRIITIDNAIDKRRNRPDPLLVRNDLLHLICSEPHFAAPNRVLANSP